MSRAQGERRLLRDMHSAADALNEAADIIDAKDRRIADLESMLKLSLEGLGCWCLGELCNRCQSLKEQIEHCLSK